jgi:outer membrane protein
MRNSENMSFLKQIGKLLLIHSSLLIFNYSLLNGQTYTLQQCIHKALETNPELKMLRLSTKTTELQHRQSKWNLLPSVNVGSGVNYNIGYTINPLNFSFEERNAFSGNVNLSSQVTLFQGFQQLKTIQKAEIDHQAVDYQIQSLENNIKMNVIGLYLQAILEYESYRIQKKQVEASEFLLTKKKEAAENGLVAKNTFREQQLQLEIDQANLSNQIFRFENSQGRLKLSLQIPQSFDFTIDTNYTPSEIEDFYNSNQLNFKKFDNHPDVQLEQMRLASAEKQLEINQGSLLPTLTFGYAFGSNFINTASTVTERRTINNPVIGYVNDSSKAIVRSVSSQSVAVSESAIPIFTQLGNNKQHQFQLNLQWQVFGKGQRRTNVKLAELQTKQQEYRVKLTEQKIKENYFQAFSNVLAAKKRYETNMKVFDAQKERYQMAKEKYELNLIDFFEFATYQNQLFNAELEVSKAKLEWNFNREIVRLYK